MRFILLLILLFTFSYSLLAQEDIRMRLTSEQKEEIKQDVLLKVQALASLIDNISSTSSPLSRGEKFTEIDKGRYLFYEFDRRYMYLTSSRYPNGQKRKMRDYFHNLIMLSEKYYLVKIEWMDYIMPMDNSTFKFAGYTETGDAIYEGKVFFKQVFVEYKRNTFTNKEIPALIAMLEDVDMKYVDVKIVFTKSMIGTEWKVFYSIKLGDVHAKLLKNKQ